MKELLEAGVHFGHQTKRWNPKMKEYIFGERNGIYIIDLQKTLKLFKDAMRFVGEMAASGKTVLFVGTKRQAQEAIAEEETPVEEIPEYAQFIDPKYAEQLMSESMPDEDLPSTSLPRKTVASEAAVE